MNVLSIFQMYDLSQSQNSCGGKCKDYQASSRGTGKSCFHFLLNKYFSLKWLVIKIVNGWIWTKIIAVEGKDAVPFESRSRWAWACAISLTL